MMMMIAAVVSFIMTMMIVVVVVGVVVVLAKVAAERVGRARGIEKEPNRRRRDCRDSRSRGLQVARALLPRRHAR